MKKLLIVAGMVLVPGVAGAQHPPNSWSELMPDGWSTVHVMDDAGVEVSGRFVRLNPDSLVLLIGDKEIRLEAPRVRRIQKQGDSLRNGVVIGALVGVGVGLLASGIADCPGADAGGSCPGFRAAALVGSTGLYAGLGAGIDALVSGRTTLYEGPTPRSGTRVAPLHHAGINLQLSW